MPLLTTVGMLMGGASAIKGFLGGGKMARAGRRALADIEEVQLTNAFQNVKPSLEAERRMFGQSATRLGSIADVAQGMDASSAMALLNTGQEKINEFELSGIQSMIDKNYEADVLRGQDDVRIEQQLETRTQNRRAEAISQIQAGEQMQTDALSNAAQIAMTAGMDQAAKQAKQGFDPGAMTKQRLGKRMTRLTGQPLTQNFMDSSIKGMRSQIRGAGGGLFGSKSPIFGTTGLFGKQGPIANLFN